MSSCNNTQISSSSIYENSCGKKVNIQRGTTSSDLSSSPLYCNSGYDSQTSYYYYGCASSCRSASCRDATCRYPTTTFQTITGYPDGGKTQMRNNNETTPMTFDKWSMPLDSDSTNKYKLVFSLSIFDQK